MLPNFKEGEEMRTQQMWKTKKEFIWITIEVRCLGPWKRFQSQDLSKFITNYIWNISINC